MWLTVMGELYGRVAVRLNGWENHKTEDEYQNHLIIKKFSFEFVQVCHSVSFRAKPFVSVQ